MTVDHKETVRKLYEDAWASHGPSALGVGWASKEEQEVRFHLIIDELKSDEDRISILDVGCGDGKLCARINPSNTQYTGIDQNSKAIDHAKGALEFLTTRGISPFPTPPNFIAGDFLTIPALPSTYDYCVASGTLNYYNVDTQFQIARRMWDLCKIGIVFNARDLSYTTIRSWAYMFKAKEWLMRGGYIENSDELTAVYWK